VKRRVRFYPNDPDAPVGLVSATPLTPDAHEPKFTIEGRRYAPAPYAPGTLAFQYWQGEIALARTIRVWEELFDRDFASWHEDQPLRVLLRAGKDLNAFYDRKSLQFFYDTDRETGRAVYAVESLDVVAHEAGHAVLDVYQPDLWSTPDLEAASFHEAFADCSALLTTLTDPAVRKALLAEADGRWEESNQVSRLAEALGRALHDNYGPQAVSDPTRLRDARNRFRYSPPEEIRPGAPDTALAPEPHSFSRVFSGAFYDTLLGVLALELVRNPGEAGIEAARIATGRLLARTVETMPPGEARYRSIALRMRALDQEEAGGTATPALEAAFARHGIRLPALASRASAGRGLRARAPRQCPRDAALKSLDPDRPGGGNALRAALGLSSGQKLARIGCPLRTRTGFREQLTHTEEVCVRHSSLGRLSGIVVRVPCGCTLMRNAGGDVEGVALAPRPARTTDDVARMLLPWIRMGAIDPHRGSRAETRERFLERMPFRLTASGFLARVYFD